MKKYKVTFIGAGYMATEHIKAFKNIPDVQLAGIYDLIHSQSESVALEYGIEEVCDSIEELYLRTRADLVVIAVSELSTREVVLKAFEYPWICLIEKPIGYNLEETQLIAVERKTKNRDAYIALNRRHYSSTRQVVKALEQHEGKRLVHVYDQENPSVGLEGGKPKLVVDHWMYANSIHVIDYFDILCRGDLVVVENIIKWEPDSPSFVMSKLSYTSGDIGIYEAIWEGPGPWAVTVTTNSRRWELRPLEQASVQEYKSRKKEALEVHPWDMQFKPGLRFQAEEVMKAVRGEPNKLPKLEDGLRIMHLIKQIYGI